ncbi:hypothetical protein ALP39_02082 [Pseudomonas marginalis pv. marginalis]|nr:hypothetical protein ALP39_02082 [Pseudomonas marginalis pv. marginalis]
MTASLYVGCAGWSLPREHWPAFSDEGTHLQRYASRFNAVEINSSFYRPHLPKTYARWGGSVPPGFLFSLKMPKRITHELRLRQCETALDEFLEQCAPLGERLGCLLVQLPPSLSYEPSSASAFFMAVRRCFAGNVVLEPRHASWLAAEAMLQDLHIGRVAVDPPVIDAAPTCCAIGDCMDHRAFITVPMARSVYASSRDTLTGRSRTVFQPGAFSTTPPAAMPSPTPCTYSTSTRNTSNPNCSYASTFGTCHSVINV